MERTLTWLSKCRAILIRWDKKPCNYLGLLLIAHAIGLHLGMRRARAGVIGPALLVLSGVGLVVAGSFPWRAADGAFVVPTGHIAGAFLAFLGAGCGLVVLSRRMAGDPRWRGLLTYALASGLAIIVLFAALFALARVPGAPLYPWAGVVQRATVAVWFACTIVLALRLRRVTADSLHGIRPPVEG